MILNEDIYTLGPEGQTKGKGKQGFEGANRIVQSMADACGYTIYHLANPNLKSEYLFSEKEGYQTFDAKEEKKLSRFVGQTDQLRWEGLVKVAKTYDSKIKKYEASENPISLSEDENRGLKMALELLMIDEK